MPKAQRQRLRSLGVIERERLKTKARKGWVAADDELKALMAEKKDGYVLSGIEGQPLEPGNLRRTFAGMVKGTKYEKLTPYDLRHTFAMRLLEEGVDVKTAAELMRHSVEVFLRRYVRSDKARKIAAMKKIQESRQRAKFRV
jgi:integrase/recombinase XerD